MFKSLFSWFNIKLGNRGIVGDGSQLKYGWVRGGKAATPLGMSSSVVLSAASGRFVDLDATGFGEIATATSTTIFGFVVAEAQTCNSTDGATKVSCITDNSAIFRIPISSGTYTDALKGMLCDLAVSSNIQGAAVQTSTRSVIRLLDGDDTAGWVDVQMVDGVRTEGAAA